MIILGHYKLSFLERLSSPQRSKNSILWEKGSNSEKEYCKYLENNLI